MPAAVMARMMGSRCTKVIADAVAVRVGKLSGIVVADAVAVCIAEGVPVGLMVIADTIAVLVGEALGIVVADAVTVRIDAAVGDTQMAAWQIHVAMVMAGEGGGAAESHEQQSCRDRSDCFFIKDSSRFLVVPQGAFT